MSDDWREELIEKMAKAAWESDGTTCDLLLETYLTEARAALAVAEPVIREQCAKKILETNWVDADPEEMAAEIRRGE